MISRYHMTLRAESPARPRPEWAYRLYAALLEQVPKRFSFLAHEDAVTPVSQFLSVGERGELRWTVSLLGERSEDAVSPLLERLEGLSLDRGISVAVLDRERRALPDVEALFALAEREGSFHRMDFCTPTAFRSQGRYLNLPGPRLLLQSLVRQWNGCVTDCPIQDEDGGGLDALAHGLIFRGFRLRDRSYYLKGSVLPGFIGSMELENRQEGFHRLLADALLHFATYAGVGIKTALGMGGVERR